MPREKYRLAAEVYCCSGSGRGSMLAMVLIVAVVQS